MRVLVVVWLMVSALAVIAVTVCMATIWSDILVTKGFHFVSILYLSAAYLISVTIAVIVYVIKLLIETDFFY